MVIVLFGFVPRADCGFFLGHRFLYVLALIKLIAFFQNFFVALFELTAATFLDFTA